MTKQIKIAVSGTSTLPYEHLVEFQGDLKDLSKEAYEKLRHEISERGFSFAIHVWQHGGKNFILDGHQRLRTVKQMVEKEGWATPELPVVFVEAKSLKEAKMKVLSGTSQYGEMTGQGLYEFVIDAEITMDELNESMQFPEIDLEDFNGEFFADPNGDGEYDPKEDEVPTITKIKRTKKGELYTLGNHRLLCGDALDHKQIDVLMGKEKADLVFTDPPYNLGFKYNSYEDDKDPDEYRKFCSKWFANLKRFSPNLIITPGTKNLGMWCQIENPLHVACWIKKNWISSCSISNLQQWEPILFYGKFERSRPSDLFEINRVYQEDVGDDHPCPKQVALIEDILKHYAKDLILDIFGGSGTTLIAAEKLGTACRIMEIDPHYCDVILERWALYTGLDPVRSDGIPWSKIKTQRTRETKIRKASPVVPVVDKSKSKKRKASVKPVGVSRTTRTSTATKS